MRWQPLTMSTRDFEHEWKQLRGRAHLWHRQARLILRTDGPEETPNETPVVPPLPFASADDMRRAGWAMDYRRDEQGRLA